MAKNEYNKDRKYMIFILPILLSHHRVTLIINHYIYMMGLTYPQNTHQYRQPLSGNNIWQPVLVCSVASVMSDSLRPHGRCSPPGSSLHGILQARILGCVAIPLPEDLPEDLTQGFNMHLFCPLIEIKRFFQLN